MKPKNYLIAALFIIVIGMAIPAFAAGITIGSGAIVTLVGSPIITTVDLTININGTLYADANSTAIINVSGNWSNSGTFTAGKSTVILNGNSQSISGSTTFYNLTKEVTSAYTLTFEAAKEQTVTHSLTLKGTPGNLLSIISSDPDTPTQAKLTLGGDGIQYLEYLNVKDNNALGGQTLAAGPDSNDLGNNLNWTFEILSVILRTYNDLASYDTWSIGLTKETDTVWTMGTNEAVLVKNNSNVPLDFSLQASTESSAGPNWTLAGATGVDTCVLMGLFNENTAPAADAYSTAYDLIGGTLRWANTDGGNGNYEGVGSGANVAVGAGEKLYLYFKTPTSVSWTVVPSGVQETITVTVGAREHE